MLQHVHCFWSYKFDGIALWWQNGSKLTMNVGWKSVISRPGIWERPLYSRIRSTCQATVMCFFLFFSPEIFQMFQQVNVFQSYWHFFHSLVTLCRILSCSSDAHILQLNTSSLCFLLTASGTFWWHSGNMCFFCSKSMHIWNLSISWTFLKNVDLLKAVLLAALGYLRPKCVEQKQLLCLFSSLLWSE